MSKNEFNQAPIAIAVPHSVNPINGNEKVLLVNGQAMVVVGQVLASSPVEAESQDHLLPYREEKKWHYDLCDRCCSCTGDCFIAWFCNCFALGQVASKLRALGVNYCLDFRGIVMICCILFVVDLFCQSINLSFSCRGFFTFLITFQLRGLVRRKNNIPGGDCDDCCVAFWCAPCAVTQIVGQLWKTPKEVPGCSCSDGPAHLP